MQSTTNGNWPYASIFFSLKQSGLLQLENKEGGTLPWYQAAKIRQEAAIYLHCLPSEVLEVLWSKGHLLNHNH